MMTMMTMMTMMMMMMMMMMNKLRSTRYSSAVWWRTFDVKLLTLPSSISNLHHLAGDDEDEGEGVEDDEGDADDEDDIDGDFLHGNGDLS